MFSRTLAGRLVFSSALMILGATASAQWLGPTPAGEVYYTGGPVGVGTATPLAQFQVSNATSGLPAFVAQSATGQTGDTFRITESSTAPVVGVGASGSNTFMKLYQNGAGNDLRIQNTNVIANVAALQILPSDGANVNMSMQLIPKGTGLAGNRAQISVFGTDYLADSINYEAFSLRASGSDYRFTTSGIGTGQHRSITFSTGSDVMTIATSGNVGIGTTTPGSSYKLDVIGAAHVTGNMTVDGNIAAKYQDVAEWVPTTTTLKPGTVVVLNPSKINEVMSSTFAYDTAVAGVVSEHPGIILGEAATHKAAIASVGRVRVLVDARKQAIRVGDLLVTSDTPGRAMKSEPLEIGGRKLHQPGTIIGKALESIETGQGEILVLLSLG